MNTEAITELDLIRYKAKKSLLFSTRYFFKKRHGRKFVVNDHHEQIAEALEKTLRGEITRLIINIAPRYGKTELAVKNYIAHGLALSPAAKFIHLTYAKNLALDNSEEAKDIVMDPSFQELFPHVSIKKDSKAKEKWYTESGGGVYAAAAGGQVTGFGAGKVDEEDEEAIDDDTLKEFAAGMHEIFEKGQFGGAIIIDDPIKPEDASSMVKRTRVNERFESTIRNRVNSRKTPIIIIQQRTHAEDLSGYLMEIEPDDWKVLKLPSLKEDGTALWEMKHTVEELLKIKRVSPYVFEAQYQQDPQPIKKGGEFYKLFSQTRNVIKNPKVSDYPKLYNPAHPLHLSFDFNRNPYMTCSIWQLYGKKAVQIDEICLASPQNRTESVCKEFIRRYPEHESGMFIYGDPSGKTEDTRTEQGQNDYTIILRELKQYRPTKRVLDKHPPVKMRGDFINAVFSGEYDGIELAIGDNCQTSVNDYMFTKEDSDGTKLKERVKDPVTGIAYEKYGHTSDSGDYFICFAFAREFAMYQKGGVGTGQIVTGGNTSKNSY